MALACGQVADHSTLVAFVSSLKAEIAALFRDILLVCAEQDLLGGTHFALDGVKLPSNAAKEWSGTFADLRRKQEKLEAKLQQVLAQHERADKEGGEATAAAWPSEQQRRHAQLFGQHGQNFPPSHGAKLLKNKISEGTVAAVECCYGAELSDSFLLGKGQMGICNA